MFGLPAQDFALTGQSCIGRVVDVYDGDTLRVVFMPKQFTTPIQMRVRMAGYDSAELKQPVLDPDRERKRALAIAARNRLQALVLHKVVCIDCGPFDKYGRPLVTLTLVDPSNVELRAPRTVNSVMMDEGFGQPYNGGTKPVH